MRHSDVRKVILYYYSIPGMLSLLGRERSELEEEYNSLRATAMDGMPHGGTPGKPVEELAARIADGKTGKRLREIEVKICVLSADAAQIRACLDALRFEYKKLLVMKYRNGDNWARIGVHFGRPESTVRRWHDKALARLGEALDESPMPDELLRRASRART